jgi:hypothetical protein
MIPRTVNIAAEVAAQLSPTELANYGNVIFPAHRGWTNNYAEYYTRLPVNGYGQVPGNPTMFEYTVHSWTKPTGPIKTIGGNGTWVTGGQNDPPGTYTNVALTGGSGSGAQATIVVKDVVGSVGPILTYTQTSGGNGYPAAALSQIQSTDITGGGYGAQFNGGGSLSPPPSPLTVSSLDKPGENYRPGDVLALAGGIIPAEVTVQTVGLKGTVTSVVITNPGTGYKVGDSLTAAVPGGSGFRAPVGEVEAVAGTGNEPRWAQAPRRFFQNQTAAFVPPTPNQRAIQYSYMYPVVDNPDAPPIDTL